MKKIAVLLFCSCTLTHLHAQNPDVTPLFQGDQALDMKLTVSIKDIKKKTNDSTYLPSMLYVKNAAGGWDSTAAKVRARGIFRRKNCYFSPIRVKIAKKDAKGTVFEGNKSLKLVMPCMNNNAKNALVLREYICYKMFEQLTPYYFNTRLINLDFTEADGKKAKNFQLAAFFIEDDDLVAKRHHAKVMDKLNLHPKGLNDTSALRHDFFQLMIANTDWSTTFLHNAKVIFQEPRKYIPLAYDFDMSGFVNPPYAEVNVDLGITSIRDRLYRGFCRAEGPTQAVRKEYLAAEPKVMGVLANYEQAAGPKEYADMKGYVSEFFGILKDDKKFKEVILDGCRTK
jgi:hypothetical protein